MEGIRTIKRKPDVTKANAKNFIEENARMGVQNELDLLIGESKDKTALAKGKMDRGLIEYSQQAAANVDEGVKSKKKERQERYLTV